MPVPKQRPTPNEIMREVTRLRAAPAQSALASLLDGVDAWRAVESIAATLPRLLMGGPKIVQGALPSAWVGVIIWQRAQGYTGYRTLRVMGIWAQHEPDAPRLIVGYKLLAYAAPFYDAEAYHKLIRKQYDLYYADDGAPPREHRLYDAPYVPEARLITREAVRAALAGTVG
jgi:hypothetical protein